MNIIFCFNFYPGKTGPLARFHPCSPHRPDSLQCNAHGIPASILRWHILPAGSLPSEGLGIRPSLSPSPWFLEKRMPSQSKRGKTEPFSPPFPPFATRKKKAGNLPPGLFIAGRVASCFLLKMAYSCCETLERGNTSLPGCSNIGCPSSYASSGGAEQPRRCSVWIRTDSILGFPPSRAGNRLRPAWSSLPCRCPWCTRGRWWPLRSGSKPSGCPSDR